MEKQTWASRAGFVMAAVGSAVGLGNIWRYPYVVYENGGGAFLIPYLFALLTAGIPLLILEFSIGHKYRGSAPLAFRRMGGPGWEWLGWWQVLISFVIATYYAVIIAWAISYTYFSFGQSWGTDTTGFFIGKFLELPDGGYWDPHGLKWQVAIPLLLVWLISFIILYRGVSKGIEKVNKIFIPILVGLMILILIRSLTLPGAVEGLNHLLTPNWDMIFDSKVWVAAYGQIFFSLSIAFAIMVTYSGYLPKKSDINNNAFITAFANSGFEFLAAIAVFSALGFMAQAQGVEVTEVVSAGVGLAFMVFPQIINEMPALNGLFGVIFFMSLVIAGTTSLISIVNVVVQAVADKFNMSYKRAVVLLHLLFLPLSLLFATGSGLIYLDIVDNFVNKFGITFAGLIEAIMIAWMLRKLQELNNHANPMSDFHVNKIWLTACIGLITPLVLGFMLFNNFRTTLAEGYEGYPADMLFVLGWMVALALIVAGVMMRFVKWPDHVSVTAKEEGN